MFSLNSLNQTVFNWETAMLLALASDLVYQRAQAVENLATRNWNLDGCRFLELGDTECFIAPHEFGDPRLVPGHGIAQRLAGEPGFPEYNQVLRERAPRIRRRLRPHGAPSWSKRSRRYFHPQQKVIHLTGHSLGAALATIAACELHGRFRIAGIYTFGQPRLGDSTTVQFFQTHHAPRFPPIRLRRRYRHQGPSRLQACWEAVPTTRRQWVP